MAKEYLDKLSTFIDQVPIGRAVATLKCKHFFSGAALYVNSKICITLSPVGLALKLPESSRNKLLENKLAIPLQYFPKAPIKKDYILLPNGLNNTGIDLHQYVQESITYALTLSE